jgi:hypothetical protein
VPAKWPVDKNSKGGLALLNFALFMVWYYLVCTLLTLSAIMFMYLLVHLQLLQSPQTVRGPGKVARLLTIECPGHDNILSRLFSEKEFFGLRDEGTFLLTCSDCVMICIHFFSAHRYQAALESAME